MSSATASSGGSAPTILHRVPASFALPSADPRALAVETMLRIAQVRYTKQDGHYRDLAVSIPKDAAPAAKGKRRTQEYGVVRGLPAVMKALGSSLDTDIIANDQRPVAACVETLTTKCLFPAFAFLTFYDYGLFQYGVSKSVTPKIGSLWESVRGTFRTNVLRENPYFYGDANAGTAPPSSTTPSLGRSRVMEAILDEVTRALKSLELLHVSHAGANESFFLGTSRPCSTDAYAYAAASAFFHADFSSLGSPAGGAAGSFVVSPVMARFQQKAREECPLLLKYVEKVRLLLYEDYSSSYNLKPAALGEAVEQSAAMQAAEDLYVKGRLRALVTTGVFAFVYFVIVNADLLAAMAEEYADHDEEEEAHHTAETQ